MWGKASAMPLTMVSMRITPTHVGKSSLSFFRSSSTWDHPHPCGEKTGLRFPSEILSGSPPPMWGKVANYKNGESLIRITPTHVGKSHIFPTLRLMKKDHPHPCGEKEVRRCYRLLLRRITPTHVGKSILTYRASFAHRDHPHPCGEKWHRAQTKIPS